MTFVDALRRPHAQSKKPARAADAHAAALARPAAHRSTRSKYAFSAGESTARTSTCATFATHVPEEEASSSSPRHSQFGSESQGVSRIIPSHAVFAATSAPTPEAPSAVTAAARGSGAQNPWTTSPSASVSVHAHFASAAHLSRLSARATHAAAVASSAETAASASETCARHRSASAVAHESVGKQPPTLSNPPFSFGMNVAS